MAVVTSLAERIDIGPLPLAKQPGASADAWDGASRPYVSGVTEDTSWDEPDWSLIWDARLKEQ
jgi:hypothetical protein